MKTKDKKELHTKSKSELLKMLSAEKENVVKYNLEKAQNKLNNTSILRNARRTIAVIMSILKEKELIKNG